jgi:hypothetical protein
MSVHWEECKLGVAGELSMLGFLDIDGWLCDTRGAVLHGGLA